MAFPPNMLVPEGMLCCSQVHCGSRVLPWHTQACAGCSRTSCAARERFRCRHGLACCCIRARCGVRRHAGGSLAPAHMCAAAVAGAHTHGALTAGVAR
eukprot:7821123-Pyramimonas_sp.AAC.1